MRKAYIIKNTCIRPLFVKKKRIRVCFPITRIQPKPQVNYVMFSVDIVRPSRFFCRQAFNSTMHGGDKLGM